MSKLSSLFHFLIQVSLTSLVLLGLVNASGFIDFGLKDFWVVSKIETKKVSKDSQILPSKTETLEKPQKSLDKSVVKTETSTKSEN
ncbi:hypothetical protein MJH12_12015 [bacterium]|nr:hypothetical protein [bacterium]